MFTKGEVCVMFTKGSFVNKQAFSWLQAYFIRQRTPGKKKKTT